ncbi:MAG TPA: RAMP superfamily CRISPR-associated protein [Polyangiaceae bacterium]|jgi:CRISPR-associated protein Cmr2|nr:RAMP superfamily CRISPR-associated protein [Polyangiaceae bacterium]
MTFEYIDPFLTKLKDDKEGARRDYQSNPQKGHPGYEPASTALLRDWLALSVTFQLQAPWFSKDDLPFHVLDNPVHRDHVFGAPFMSASSWKGLLRWTARMKTGLLAHLEANDNSLKGKEGRKDWKDSPEVIHLFGNECEEAEHFQRGALAFRPTWFDKVGFEVINPHDRAKKAGTKPILYEVVPAGATGTLSLLYAPTPGAASVDRQQAVLRLLDAVEAVLTEYGFSAKRTSGWGVATITKASLRWQGGSSEGTFAKVREAATKQTGGGA